MRRSIGIGILALAGWLNCCHAQQVPVVQRPSFAAMGYEAAYAGGPSSPYMEGGPLVNPTAEGPWLNGPYQVDSGCGNCGSGNCGGGNCGSGNCGGGNCGGGNCGGGCQPQRRHGQGPFFSDTVCDDCAPCFPQSFPVYASLFGGWSNIDNFERKLREPIPGLETDEEFITEISGFSLEDSYAAGGAVGWVVHPLARTELEFTYRQNDAQSYDVQDFALNAVDSFIELVSDTSTPATGSLQAYSGMFNFVVHTEPRRLGCASLYGGGGIGVLYAEGDFATPAESFAISDSSFAYQFIAGVNYVVSYRLDTYVEYRYLGADYLQVQNLTSGLSMGDFNFDSNAVFFGFRFGR